MPLDVRKTKLMDALHGAMPTEHDRTQSKSAQMVAKALEGIMDLVTLGELDGTPEQTDAEKNIDKLKKAGDEGAAEAGKALADAGENKK